MLREDLPNVVKDIKRLVKERSEKTERIILMEVFRNVEEAQLAFDEYYSQAFSDVRDRIVQHFREDNWTNEQIEAIIGEPISADFFEHYLPLHERIDDEIRNSSDFDLQALISYAKDFGLDLEGIKEPYKIIVLKHGPDDVYWNEHDDSQYVFQNEERIGNNLDKYIICQDKDDLIKAWKQLKKEKCILWYGVKNGEGLIENAHGLYRSEDVKYLKVLPDYKTKTEMSEHYVK